MFVDNLRLERDDTARRAGFDGLFAFDFGPATSPVLEGFTAVTPGTLYSQGRGYGLRRPRSGALSTPFSPTRSTRIFSVSKAAGWPSTYPTARYRVFVNLDSPSGFWGEYQIYRKRDRAGRGKAGRQPRGRISPR